MVGREWVYLGARVRSELKEALEAKARASERTLSQELRVAIKQHLAECDNGALRRKDSED